MILLVPISPEVPKQHDPVLWPALLLLLLLGAGFFMGSERILSDLEYISNLKTYLIEDATGKAQLSPEAHEYLKNRPLLAIAPAKGDWDLARLLYANFLHGSLLHLGLNWVGVFAGARICTTFLPFYLTFAIFLLGGSLGLFTSLWLSTEATAFIPHIGASGGIFALMGTYYVYNFRFRTRYFFWWPGRHGSIKLRTSWFFFVDVILLELVLSTGQFLPDRVDSVDHLAHVVGFGSGVVLALLLRQLQRWPSFVQTRAEYQALRHIPLVEGEEPRVKAFRTWISMLKVNPYNDAVKRHLCHLLARHAALWTPEQVDLAFSFLSPTFLRLQTESAKDALAGVLAAARPLPAGWLASTPYDSIILLSQAMAREPQDQPFLIPLVTAYRRAHPEGGNTERKLELLMAKLASFPPPESSQRRA